MQIGLTSATTFTVCALRFFRRSLGFLFAASIALSGCASKPAYDYNWRATAVSDHIPTDGLVAAPQVIASNQPIALVNLGNDNATRHWDARQRVIGDRVSYGAADGAIRTGIAILPLCVIPPLCIGVMAAGAAMGGAIEGAMAERKYRPTWLSPEEAATISAILNEHATSTSLQKRILNTGPRAADQQGFPRLVVRLEAVELLMDGNGVASFVLRAQAQAFPAPNVEWKPTEHVVRFPSRRPNVWLASDGKFLLSTLNTALDTLSASIVSVYLPEKRMSSNQESSPLVEALGNNATDASPGIR